MIPYARQSIDQSDIDSVIECLKSDFLTQGPKISEFESATAKYCGAKFGVAVSNATAALHLACLALGVGPGDVVWTSPITFVASANCALYCGANIDFVDVDPETGNISVSALGKKLEEAKKTGSLPKVIIAVHLAGQSCEMKEIAKLAEIYRFKIIEDASHAIGGTYLDQPVGSCKYSDLTVFSFHPVKIITTAEGGMVVTNNQSIAEKLEILRSHGITRDPAKMSEPSHGAWYYQQIDLGFNYRLTDIQAALGISQLKRIDSFVSKRKVLASRYDQALSALPLQPLVQKETSSSALHLYIVRLNEAKRRDQIFKSLRESGIGVNVHYIPVHTQPYYRQLGFKQGDFPLAEQFYREIISLPLYPDLTEHEQDQVVSALKQIL